MATGVLGAVEDAIAEAVSWLMHAADWLGHKLDEVGGILGAIWPPVLAAIAVVALLRTVRWLLLLWRGRTPRVQISPFAWSMSEEGRHEAIWVTSLFREQLAALRLDALDPLPERAPGAPLVEIVEGVGQGVGRDIAGAAGRLFKAAWPDSAYEVWGTVRPHEEGGGRISVQLIERRRGNRTLLNVALEEASWEDGAREAAMAVAGALYPQVKETDRGPWTEWKRTIPRKLIGHYHAARRYEEDNRLEQALAEYHAALDQDPLNPNLRLKIAMLQERLELYLDAWVTYEAIVDETDRRAWRGPNRRVYLLALYRLAVMLSNGRVAAQWVKGAARREADASLRDRERQERRDELQRSLARSQLFSRHWTQRAPDNLRKRFAWATSRVRRLFAWRISRVIAGRNSPQLMTLLRWIDASAASRATLLETFAQAKDDEEEEERRKRRIETVLRILGLKRLEELETSLRIVAIKPREWPARWVHGPSLRQRLGGPEFARSAVRTSKLLVRTRIAASLENEVGQHSPAEGELENADRWIDETRQAHRNLTRRWPFPSVSWWRTTLHFLGPRRRWANRRDDVWQLHYNAACAVATVLRTDSVLRNFEEEEKKAKKAEKDLPAERKALPTRTTKDAIVERAIELLEEYAFRAGSNRVAAQADWLAIDDPDLGGLRKEPAFQRWGSHHLPRALPQGELSRRADVKRFTARVAHEGALAIAAVWRERADRVHPTDAEIAEWWRREAQIWAELGNAWREHLSWQERLNWLETLDDWLRNSAVSKRVDFSHEARGAAADAMTPKLFERLAVLAGDGESGNGKMEPGLRPPDVLAWVGKRVDQVRIAHETGEGRADTRGVLLADVERLEALRAFRVWTRLAELLEIELTRTLLEDPDEETREEAKREQEEELRAMIDLVHAELPVAPSERSPGSAL